MNPIKVNWITYDECRSAISELEARVGKTSPELKRLRETWDVTVQERNALESIEDYEFLLGGEAPHGVD